MSTVILKGKFEKALFEREDLLTFFTTNFAELRWPYFEQNEINLLKKLTASNIYLEKGQTLEDLIDLQKMFNKMDVQENLWILN